MNTPDTEKCEHKVVKKYCFRCKRPDLAGNVKNTPDTEWSEIKYIVQKYVESKTGQVHALTKLESCIQTLLTSRDTYWRERVRKEVEYSRDWICSRGSHPQEYSSHLNTVSVSLVEKTFKKLDTLLDNLK